MNESRALRRAGSRLAVLIGLLCLIAQPGNAQQQSLRDRVDRANLRFIGLERAGVEVVSVLTVDDVALLVATDEVRTLNYLIGGRLPVKASRLQQLIAWGLLRQEGNGFKSLIAVIKGDRAQRLDDLIEAAVPAIVAESYQAMERLADRLWRHPGVASLPAVTAWMMRDRVWAHLAGPNGLDFGRYIAEQQLWYPEREFWGGLWYVENPTPPPFDFREWRRADYTIHIAWDYGSGDPLFGVSDGKVPMTQVLAKLRRGGRKLDDRDDFPGALAAGLVDDEGNMRVLALEYKLDNEDGLAYAIEEAAVAITEAILRHLPVGTLASLLSVGQETAGVIGYTELAGRLVTEFYERGLLVRTGDPRADWRAAAGTRDHGPGPPRHLTIVGDDSNVAMRQLMPPYSAIIWRDLPTRPKLRIAWW